MLSSKIFAKKIMEVFEPITFYIRHDGKRYEVKAIPYDEPDGQNIPLRFLIIIGLTPRGEIERKLDKWESTDIKDEPLLNAIANNILKYYK
jgi:hypothetical protein